MTGYIKGMRSPKSSIVIVAFFVCGVQLQVVDGFSSSCRVWYYPGCSTKWCKCRKNQFSTCRDSEGRNMIRCIKGMLSPKCSVDMYGFFGSGVQQQVLNGFV